jgi:HTH-type transcriptional regulator/antitoxin HigA
MRNTTRTDGRSSEVSNAEINIRVDTWTPLSGTIFVPHTEEEYNRIVAVLDRLIDEVGEDENHPLASMMEILGVLIEHYENAHVPALQER